MSSKKKGIRISYAQAVHGDEEKKRVVNVLDEHRTLTGKESREFEERTAAAFGKKFGIMVNSGSSANTLAFEILDLPKGSEVITPLLTFATTVAPIVRAGLVPVFADVEPGTYNINIDQVEKLITKKTKALMIPLLLGNLPDIERLSKLAKKHKLYFIEDSCDTFGPTFKNKPSGTYSDISVTSFYGSHIITAGGGGGMIMVNNAKLKDRARVLRGWGRSSSLFSESEAVEDRFKAKIGGIQYDAKFIFDEIGYNFLHPELCAAFGNAQLDKLPEFKKRRDYCYKVLLEFFEQYEDLFVLPKQDPRVSTQWLAFPLTLKESAPFTRLELVKYLEENNIQTRPIFTGNILKQPAFKNIKHRMYRNGSKVTEEIMKGGLLIGCHHGLTEEQLTRMKEVFTTFIKKHK
jgi:CDP-4-dehydro-6-deoxyglucose reductase, E1